MLPITVSASTPGLEFETGFAAGRPPCLLIILPEELPFIPYDGANEVPGVMWKWEGPGGPWKAGGASVNPSIQLGPTVYPALTFVVLTPVVGVVTLPLLALLLLIPLPLY